MSDADKFVTHCDFDKFQAGSSLIVLDYDIKVKKFIVMKRIEVPRGEYTLDNAVKKIIEVNDIYNPRWIFIDRGYGEKIFDIRNTSVISKHAALQDRYLAVIVL